MVDWRVCAPTTSGAASVAGSFATSNASGTVHVAAGVPAGPSTTAPPAAGTIRSLPCDGSTLIT